MLRYYFKLREPGIGCQPSEGLIQIKAEPCEIEGHKFWGWAEYDRILDDEEINRYDIYSLFEIVDWNYKAKEQQIMKVIAPLKRKHTAVEIHREDDRFCIVHPSTKQEGWQISFFDAIGPYSDHQSSDLLDVVKTLVEYNFVPATYQYN